MTRQSTYCNGRSRRSDRQGDLLALESPCRPRPGAVGGEPDSEPARASREE